MKVFQIGFNKCGTRTLHQYFIANGAASIHWDRGFLARRLFKNLIEGEDLISGYEHFDVFTDMEFSDSAGLYYLEGYKLFPHLVRNYPEALFIMNTRNRDDWIRSRLKHSEGRFAEKQMLYFGCQNYNELTSLWKSEWDRHHNRVIDFFYRKTHRFLVCDIGTDLPHVLDKAIPEWDLRSERFAIYGRTASDCEFPAKIAPIAVPSLA